VSLLPVFVNSQFELRSGWKVAVYSAILAILYVVWAMFLGIVVAWIYPSLVPTTADMRALALFALAMFFPVIGALLIMARLIDHVPLSVFGITLHDRWLQDFGMGVAIASGMLGLTLVGSFLFGNVQIVWGSGSISAIGITLVMLAVAAINEELVFRGYPLQMLMKGTGPWVATLLVSSIFGLVHVLNPGATVLSVVNTILAGILLSLAYWKTRSLWLPYGVHLGWNAGLAVVLGYPVSGIETPSLLKTQVSGPATVLGGSYGPEDGMLGTVIFLLGAVVIYRMRIGRVSPQVRTALVTHAEKVYVEGL
jgi:membrane protease YdiL (CAAX protease family)